MDAFKKLPSYLDRPDASAPGIPLLSLGAKKSRIQVGMAEGADRLCKSQRSRGFQISVVPNVSSSQIFKYLDQIYPSITEISFVKLNI